MTDQADSPLDLRRFVDAQQGSYERALAELRAGRKASHWIWYIFPQLKGLGVSHTSQFYGISGLAEAQAYLAHPILGPRLRECVLAMFVRSDSSAEDILGGGDAMKFRSSMTLFSRAAPDEPLFTKALARFFAGDADPKTLVFLGEKER